MQKKSKKNHRFVVISYFCDSLDGQLWFGGERVVQGYLNMFFFQAKKSQHVTGGNDASAFDDVYSILGFCPQCAIHNVGAAASVDNVFIALCQSH